MPSTESNPYHLRTLGNKHACFGMTVIPKLSFGEGCKNSQLRRGYIGNGEKQGWLIINNLEDKLEASLDYVDTTRFAYR